MWPPTMVGSCSRSANVSSRDDALGLDDDVVVQQQDVVAAVLDGLVHAAGEAAGTAQVGLVDDPELAAERPRRFGEAVLASDTFCVPWSTIMISLTFSRTSGFSARMRALLRQNSGLLMVVICSVTLPCWLSSPSGQPLGRSRARESLGTCRRGRTSTSRRRQTASRVRSNVRRGSPSTVAGINALERTAGVGLVDDDGAGAASPTPTAGRLGRTSSGASSWRETR